MRTSIMPLTVPWKDGLNGTGEGWTYAGQRNLSEQGVNRLSGKTEKGHDKPEEGEDDRWKSQKEQIKSK